MKAWRASILCISLPLISGILTLTPAAHAQSDTQKLEAVIDKVIAAYGGDTLLNLRSYEVVESYLAPNIGQSWHPELTDVARTSFRLVHDLENGHVYRESWFVANGEPFPNLTVVNDEGAWSVDLREQSVGQAASDDPYAIAGGIMRTTDALLAHELTRSREKAEYLGEGMWMNRIHDRVKIPFPLSPDLTLYIATDSGLITRMTRDNPQIGLLSYAYEDHREVDGLIVAERMNFSIAGAPNLIGNGRTARFNQAVSDANFALTDGLAVQGERSDDSTMVVNRLADNVYHIGQNSAYSLFVDNGRELIAVGAYAGFAQRLARFREEANSYRPLDYLIVTHHHQDHIGGIDEALAVGAKLVTVEHTAPVLVDSSQRALSDKQLLLVDKRLMLGDGDDAVQIYDVSTIHSASNLLFYVPATRTLFLADHYGSPFLAGLPSANRNTMSMAEALEPLELGYRRIVTAHSARVFTDREFAASVAAYKPFECPADRPLCSG